MRNPWRMQDGPDNKINRNNFPMSFQYNGTFKYGKIYPIGLWRTIPGASYQIDSTLALNFMPTSFPIQTRQRAYVHFFYGRDRNFWKDYKDFVNGMSPDLVKPYIDEGVTLARTGNLLDYLGVPTTIVGRYGNAKKELFLETDSENQNLIIDTSVFHYINPIVSNISAIQWSEFMSIDNKVGEDLNIGRSVSDNLPGNNYPARCTYIGTSSDFDNSKDIRFNITLRSTEDLDVWTNIPVPEGYQAFSPNPTSIRYIAASCRLIAVNSSGELVSIVSPVQDGVAMQFDIYTESSDNLTYYFVCPTILCIAHNNANNTYHGTVLQALDGFTRVVEVIYSAPGVRDIDFDTSPYWRSNDTRGKSTIKLSAIPPRMYETIYNLYYRNPQNNPYILNGKPEYNIFIPTKDGGVDSNLYQLRYRNWEDDFLTTAVQTPQQGIAPLVGLTDRGATVTLTNEDGSVTRYKTNLDENGNVTGIETTDSSEPLLTQALIDAVSYGISIEDLRNVNAMQKWLELNLRKGYQYKDIIEARWGISISYNELDLPEFIGGFTQEVGLQAVTQTTSHGEGIEGALGWQAGRMYAAGSGRSIQHYCEEEGYIMALLCVVPVPNYSQLLPKHWFTRDLLESYQPEFNHIGFQPITYKEVCPIQAFQESTENVDVLEQTFGYQRPWYEYFNQVDEVHGQFRTTFKDFLINRTFDVKPELSESFLLVDPNQVNDVFAVQTDDDKIVGAIEHRITAKLPISLYAQARLE